LRKTPIFILGHCQ